MDIAISHQSELTLNQISYYKIELYKNKLKIINSRGGSISLHNISFKCADRCKIVIMITSNSFQLFSLKMNLQKPLYTISYY